MFRGWNRVSTGTRWDTSARRSTSDSLGPQPWKVSEWWKAQPPGFTTTGTRSVSTPSGAAFVSGASQSSGAWKLPRSGGAFGHRCDPRTYSIVPPWANVSSSATQQVIISGGER